MGPRVSVSNAFTDLQSEIEAGYKLEEVTGWLEMDLDSFPSESCLFDIDQCNDGFTVQFWLYIRECNSEVRNRN